MAYLTSFKFNPTGDDIIDVATQGSVWNLSQTNVIHWTIADGFNGEFWIDPDYAVAKIDQALSIIEQYVNIDFQFGGYFPDPASAGTAGSDLVYSLDGIALAPNFWAVGFFPNYNNVPFDGYSGWPTQGGDIFLNINSDANDLDSYELGSSGFFLILHETFHALGLKHTFDDGGSGRPTLDELGLGEFDKDWFSVMSYSDDYPLNQLSWDPATPMLLDVLGLQYLYGPNWNTNTGNDTYVATYDNFYATVWDAGGIDLVDLSQVPEGWTVSLPNIQLSDLVPTKAGFGFPTAQNDQPSPTNFYWLIGDIENVLGSESGDTVSGNDLNNWIRGAGGNDIIYASRGGDFLNGGAGTDTTVYSGNQTSYTLTLSPTSTFIEDRRADGNGTDQLIDMELLNFDTGTFSLNQFGGTTGLSAQNFESFIELYIAYFNRAPDAVGLNFWGTAFSNGTSLEEMATLFIDQEETLAAYPTGTSNNIFAETVYNNVLGRTPDPAGFDFWVGQLDSGSVSRDQFILEVLRGVQPGTPDRSYLDTKVDIGAYFAVHKGMSDVDNAAAAMALFNGSEVSIDTSVAAIDGYYADATDAANGEFLMPLVGVLDDPFAVA
jgi:hypothetical protein